MISIVLISGDMNGQDNPSMLWSFNEYQEYHFFIHMETCCWGSTSEELSHSHSTTNFLDS